MTSVRKLKEGEVTAEFFGSDHRAQCGSARRPPEGSRHPDRTPRVGNLARRAMEKAQALQRPLPDGALRIVLRGEKEDPGLLTEA